MKKSIFRLSESQLHRVIKESVEKILKEVSFKGESLHGNNPEDWSAMEKMRGFRVNNSSKHSFSPQDNHDMNCANKDFDTAHHMFMNNAKKENPNVSSDEVNNMWKNMRQKASDKALRMQKKNKWF